MLVFLSFTIMKRTFPTYYLCNNDNEKLIEFTMFLMPREFTIIDANILRPDLVPEFFLKTKDIADAVYWYLQSCRRDYGVNGLLLDEFLIRHFDLSFNVRSYGRLTGMEYLIDLLSFHFYNEENGLYITCKEPTIVTFIGMIQGWTRIFVEQPVTKDDVVKIIENTKFDTENLICI